MSEPNDFTTNRNNPLQNWATEAIYRKSLFDLARLDDKSASAMEEYALMQKINIERLQSNPDVRDEDGQTALMVVGGVYPAQVLIDNGADVNAVDKDGCSALMHTHNMDVARVLIDNGADAHATDKAGNSVLHHIAEEKYGFEPTKLLLSKGANPNVQNNAGQTALMYLLENGGDARTIALLAVQNYDELERRDPQAAARQQEALDAWAQDPEHCRELTAARTYAPVYEPTQLRGNGPLQNALRAHGQLIGNEITDVSNVADVTFRTNNR